MSTLIQDYATAGLDSKIAFQSQGALCHYTGSKCGIAQSDICPTDHGTVANAQRTSFPGSVQLCIGNGDLALHCQRVSHIRQLQRTARYPHVPSAGNLVRLEITCRFQIGIHLHAIAQLHIY